MTLDQINTVIYQAFYNVVRIGVPTPRPDFLNSTIAATWPSTPVPTMWPNFWFDAVALEIQQGFINNGKFLPNLDGDWLKNNNGKKWSDVASWANGTNPAIRGGLINYSDAV